MTRNRSIDIAKFLLIVGVILIHSDIVYHFIDDPTLNFAASQIILFISSRMCSVCVPGFFFLSAYLYFKNIDTLTPEVYLKKTRNRFFSLIIPYLLWNLVGFFLCIIKYKFLGLEAFGIFRNDSFNFFTFLEGFWDYNKSYPYAFAFWFIRNLIVFVILAPVARILSRKILFFIFLACVIIFNNDFYGLIYFVTGAFVARYYDLNSLMGKSLPYAVGGLILWVTLEALSLFFNFYSIIYPVKWVASVSALFFIVYISRVLSQNESAALNVLVKSTFFIYAVHEFFCSATINFYSKIFNTESFTGLLSAYVCVFLTLFSGSLLIWLFFKWLSPSAVKILSGSR